MTLETGTTYNTLPVCAKCGWPMAGPSEIARHRTCPHVDAGARATELAGRFPDLASTKFGYGTQHLTFELDTDLSVVILCGAKTFQLKELVLFGDLTANEAAGLVEAIADWRSTCIRARNLP